MPLINGELQGAILERLATDPAVAIKGRAWFNSTANVAKIYDGTAVRILVDRDYLALVALANPMIAAGDTMYGGTGGAVTRLAAGAPNTVYIGGVTPSWAKITDANVDASAAIAQSKIFGLVSDLGTITSNVASNTSQIGTNTTNIATNTSNISTLNTNKADASAVATALSGKKNDFTILPTTQGGTGVNAATAADVFLALAPSVTGQSGKYLRNNGTSVLWDTIVAGLNLRPVNTTPVTAANNDLILVDSTGGARRVDAPAVASGIQFIVVDDKKQAATNFISVYPPSGGAFVGLGTNVPIVINVAGGWVWVLSNGTSYTYITMGAGIGAGGLTTVPVSAGGTSAANTLEELEAGSGFVRFLPALPTVGQQPIVVEYVDRGRASASALISIKPAAGQTIDLPGFAADDWIDLDYGGAWAKFSAAYPDTKWTVERGQNTTVVPGMQPGYTGGVAIPAGMIGEKVTSVFSGTGVGAATNLTSFPLQPGVWRIEARALTASAGANRRSVLSISLASVTNDLTSIFYTLITPTGTNLSVGPSSKTINVSVATTVYIIGSGPDGNVDFTNGYYEAVRIV